jgi:hypothetical protein
MSKDAVNVATMEVAEQEAAGQVAPEQSHLGTLSEGHLSAEQGHVPKISQDVPKQDTAPLSSTQSGLPNTVAKGTMVMGPSTAGPNQEQGRTSMDQAVESDDDVVEEIQGHPQDGR